MRNDNGNDTENTPNNGDSDRTTKSWVLPDGSLPIFLFAFAHDFSLFGEVRTNKRDSSAAPQNDTPCQFVHPTRYFLTVRNRDSHYFIWYPKGITHYFVSLFWSFGVVIYL